MALFPKEVKENLFPIENEHIKLENNQKNFPLLHLHDTPQPRNHQTKIENSHFNKLTYYLDKFLQEEIRFLRKELGKKQKINNNLINLLNHVTTHRDEKNFSCKSLQIETTFEKANRINDETISLNRFSIDHN